ncbi:MAG: hypothetical protein GY944_18530 [bacterium]|nr:hypothetical protein [bacterium]
MNDLETPSHDTHWLEESFAALASIADVLRDPDTLRRVLDDLDRRHPAAVSEGTDFAEQFIQAMAEIGQTRVAQPLRGTFRSAINAFAREMQGAVAAPPTSHSSILDQIDELLLRHFDALRIAGSPLAHDLAEGAARIRETNARSRRRIRLQTVALTGLGEQVDRLGALCSAAKELLARTHECADATHTAFEETAKALESGCEALPSGLHDPVEDSALRLLADDIHLVSIAASAEAARRGEAAGIAQVAATLRRLDRSATRLAAARTEGEVPESRPDKITLQQPRAAKAGMDSSAQCIEQARTAADTVAALAAGLTGLERTLQRIDGLVQQNADWVEEVDALAREQGERARTLAPVDSGPTLRVAAEPCAASETPCEPSGHPAVV